MAVTFVNEGVSVQIPKLRIKKWVKNVLLTEGRVAGDINIVLCSDEYLLTINQKYLQHNYFTDIITFDYSEGNLISGELLISIQRTADNAEKFNVDKQTELLRVIIHGVYHLCGYTDTSPAERKSMVSKENEGLRLWDSMI